MATVRPIRDEDKMAAAKADLRQIIQKISSLNLIIKLNEIRILEFLECRQMRYGY